MTPRENGDPIPASSSRDWAARNANWMARLGSVRNGNGRFYGYGKVDLGANADLDGRRLPCEHPTLRAGSLSF